MGSRLRVTTVSGGLVPSARDRATALSESACLSFLAGALSGEGRLGGFRELRPPHLAEIDVAPLADLHRVAVDDGTAEVQRDVGQMPEAQPATPLGPIGHRVGPDRRVRHSVQLEHI